jgi:hypothetical protein
LSLKFLKVEREEQKQIEEKDKTTEFTNLKSSSNSIDNKTDKGNKIKKEEK